MPNGNLISDAEASKFTEVSAAPTAAELLPPPRSAASVGASTPELSQGSISSAFQHDVDFVASAPKVPGVPRFSLMPVGIQEGAVTSAAIQSQIASTPATPSTIAPALGNISLDIPDIFTPTAQSEVFPNPTLAFDLALEDDGTVFAVPPNPIPNVGGLVYRASSSAPNLASRTVSTTVSTLNIGVFVTNQAIDTITPSGWTPIFGGITCEYLSSPTPAGTVSATFTTTTQLGVVATTSLAMLGFATSVPVVPTLLISGGGAWEKTGFGLTPTFTNQTVVLAVLTSLGATSVYGGSTVYDGFNEWYPLMSFGGNFSPNIDPPYSGALGQVWVCINPVPGTYAVITLPGLSGVLLSATFEIIDISGIDLTTVAQSLPVFMDLVPDQIPVGLAVYQGTDYTAAAADSGTLQVFRAPSTATFTLLGTPPSLHWFISVSNLSASALTVTCETPAKIDGVPSATIFLSTGESLTIYTDGTDYYTVSGTGGGGGGVTSLNSLTGALDIVAGTGITVTPSGSNITIDAAIGGVNEQTANYVILSTDAGKIVSMNSSSATTLKLPAASPGANFNVYVENIGTGLCTLDPNGLNLDGSASTVTLPQNQGMYISSDGTNYFSERGLATPPIPTTLVLTTGSLATGASENDTPAFPKNATLWRVTASQACRIELYATAAAQTADQAGPRPISVPPTPGTQNGVLLDLSLDFLNYTSPWLMSPPALLVNGDSPQNSQLYSTITNLGSTGAITVTFYYYQEGN